MSANRWWHAAVATTSVIVTVVLLLAGSSLLPFGLIAIAAFGLGWALVGRHGFDDPRAGVIFTILLIVVSGVITANTAPLATFQVIVFPLVWAMANSFRGAVVANIGVALSVGAGQVFANGNLGQAVLIESISLGFSIAIGLWITSIERTSAGRQVLLNELQAAQEQLGALSRDAGVTSERERLAREIHDTIAQDLTGIVLLAQRAGRELSSGDAAAAAAQLVLLEESARTALAETRALVAAGTPPALEAGGIAGALERLGERFERETSIAVAVRTSVEGTVERDLEVALLRCAQEGLANVRKHSGASRVSVRLRWDTQRSLQVSDNGAGFELDAPTDGYGLRGMRERLALAGGTLDVESGEDGTTLLVTLPLERQP